MTLFVQKTQPLNVEKMLKLLKNDLYSFIYSDILGFSEFNTVINNCQYSLMLIWLLIRPHFLISLSLCGRV